MGLECLSRLTRHGEVSKAVLARDVSLRKSSQKIRTTKMITSLIVRRQVNSLLTVHCCASHPKQRHWKMNARCSLGLKPLAHQGSVSSLRPVRRCRHGVLGTSTRAEALSFHKCLPEPSRIHQCSTIHTKPCPEEPPSQNGEFLPLCGKTLKMRAQHLVTAHSNDTSVTSTRTSPLELAQRKLQEQKLRNPQLAQERCAQLLAADAGQPLALRSSTWASASVHLDWRWCCVHRKRWCDAARCGCKILPTRRELVVMYLLRHWREGYCDPSAGAVAMTQSCDWRIQPLARASQRLIWTQLTAGANAADHRAASWA